MKCTDVLVVWLAASLIGCGGGGGGGGDTQPSAGSEITYLGLTTQASVTVDNANDIFSVIWTGGTSSGIGNNIQAVSLRPPEIISTGKALPYLFSVTSASNDFRSYMKKSKSSVAYMAAAVNYTINGSVSGTETIVGNIDDNTGTGTLTLTYLNYNNGGATYDGVLTARVDKYDLSYQAITDMTMSFSQWTIKDSLHNISISGSIRIQDDILSNKETALFNTIVRDNHTKETSKQDNFVVATTYNNIFSPSSRTETITGRVYIEKHGYVEISTISPFIYSSYPQENPDRGGPILLRGMANSCAQITPLSTSKVSIQVDADGDGVLEYTNTHYWNDLNGLPASGDNTAPTVLSTSPANAATGVSVNSAITVTFSEVLDASTITTATFTLKAGNSSIPGTVTYSGTTATFTPYIGLSSNTTYTATITTGVKDLAGNAMATDYIWSFTPSSIFASYVTFPTGSWPEAVAIGDVNNDGRNDVVITTSFYFDEPNDYKLFVFLQNASGGLDAPIKYSTSATYTGRPETVAIGDMNHDGKNDVVVGNSGCSIEVFLQNSSGGLNSGTTYAATDSHKIRIADLNNDGLMDIVGIGWGTNTVSVWQQNAGGTLDSPVIYSVTHGGYDDLDVGDINSDGLTDIVVMSGQSLLPNVGVLTQKSNGTFNAAVYYSVGAISAATLTHGVAVGDVNGDNRKDIVVTYGGNSPSAKIGAFLQNGLGTLDPALSYSSYDCPEAAEIKDVNQDGRQDVVVVHGGWNKLGVYLQGSDGNFIPEELFAIPYATHYNPHGLAMGDINGDGLSDVAIADYNNGLVVLYHQ